MYIKTIDIDEKIRLVETLCNGFINAEIWALETETDTRYSVRFKRRYRECDDSLEFSLSCIPDDLPKLGQLADRAYFKIAAMKPARA